MCPAQRSQGLDEAHAERRTGADAAARRQVALVMNLQANRVIKAKKLESLTYSGMKDFRDGGHSFDV